MTTVSELIRQSVERRKAETPEFYIGPYPFMVGAANAYIRGLLRNLRKLQSGNIDPVQAEIVLGQAIGDAEAIREALEYDHD